MSFPVRSLLMLIFLIGLLIATPYRAYACSCLPPRPPLESMANSDAVFSGKVVRIDSEDAVIMSSADPVNVVFEVSRVWKGDEKGAIALSTARDSASCGYDFVVGEEYLVYANISDTGLTTGLCSRTMPLSSAGEDLAVLGEGTIPVPLSEPTSSAIPWVLTAGAVVIGLTLLAVILLVRPRHN
jgi:hypothetical protein